ncbi:MAG TPA: MFS transporter [Opitutaceae bacterium]|nr:MFS transporter [Opitutaceae bacterium]
MTPPSQTHLSFKEKLAYGLGDTASNFFFQTFNLFLLYYYTDIFGISAGIVGTMFLVTRIFDCVTDPLMGLVADRTRSRWGKFRPWLLWMAVPYGVLGYVMFMNPDLTDSGKVVFAYVTYSAMMLVYTAINIPYGALMGVMSPSSSERTTLASYRFVCAFGGGMLVASFVTPLKNLLGGGSEIAGFQWTMAIFAVVSIALFLFTFSATRERVAPAGDENSDFRRDLGNLFRNRAWVVLFFAAIFTLTNVGVRNAVMVYYMKYYIGDDGARVFLFFDKTALFMTSGMVALIAGVACTKWFTARWGKRELMIVLSIINAISMASLFFFPPEMFVWVFVINFVGTFLNGPTPAIVWAMYADAADYGEWKFNRRTTALNFSAAQFGQKMGLAIGGAVAGWSLAGFGFVANAVQTDHSLFGIRLLFAIAPASFALLNVVALWFYPLREPMVRQIEEELAARKATATA